MDQQPLLSVIVPVYRVEAYLDRCVRSILEQTYENLELLLIDDGSPDRSGALCDAWAARDRRVRVFHQENAGAGQARNLGLDQARGELIGFVDSDDYIAPTMYAHLYSLMGPRTDIAECALVYTPLDDLPLDDGSACACQRFSAEEAMLLHIRDQRFCQTPPNKLYRRRVVEDVRFPKGTLIDDEFWTYRAIGNARELVCCDCRMYAYRQQPDSAMHKPYSIRRLDGITAKEQRLDDLRERMPRLVPEARRDLLLTCLFAMMGCLRSVPEEQMPQARTILRRAEKKTRPLQVSRDLPLRRKGLLLLARLSLGGTARLLNLLEDLHILT